jgi:hypothetical protein
MSEQALALDKLSSIIEECFLLATTDDERLCETDRETLLNHGKKLRGSLRQLAPVSFDANTTELCEANNRLVEVNSELENSSNKLDNAATFMGNLAMLGKLLDDLAAMAAKSVP